MSGGIGFLVAVVLTTLKLVGVITWPWVWVLVPLWGPLALALLLYGIAAIIGARAYGKARERQKQRRF